MPPESSQCAMAPQESVPRAGFSSLEWLVIALGARDESISLQWSPFGRSLLALMGGGPRQLASPCLETLRQTASIARHYGWAMPTADIGAFLQRGWNEAQLERLIESVCPDGPKVDLWHAPEDVDLVTPEERPAEIQIAPRVFA